MGIMSITIEYLKPFSCVKVCVIDRNTWNHTIVWFGLVWFYGLVIFWLFNAKTGFYKYTKYMICNHIFRYAKLNDQTVLFLTIDLSINQERLGFMAYQPF